MNKKGANRQTGGQTKKGQTDKRTDRWDEQKWDKQTDKRTDRWDEQKRDKQTDKWTDPLTRTLLYRYRKSSIRSRPSIILNQNFPRLLLEVL